MNFGFFNFVDNLGTGTKTIRIPFLGRCANRFDKNVSGQVDNKISPSAAVSTKLFRGKMDWGGDELLYESGNVYGEGLDT